MSVIFSPEPRHACRFPFIQGTPGAIFRCDCGQLWLGTDAPSNHVTVGQRTHRYVYWVRISERRARRIAKKAGVSL